MKIILFAAILLFLTPNLFSQNIQKNNPTGTVFMVDSEVLGHEREIQIFLPEDYTKSKENYPVLYVLDGQRYFLHAVSLQQSFVEFRQSPGFIIVGINKNPTDRNRNYSSNSKKFLEFIKNEVITYIDSEYRTSNSRMLFGWAFAGGFVIETMTANPELFNVHIAASAFPLEGKISKIDSLISKYPNINSTLYFTSEVEEGGVLQGAIKLRDLLSAKAPKSINWTFAELKDEEHRSTPFTTLYHGLKKHFRYYPELQFKNLKDYKNEGGFDNVLEYQKKRARQYGFSEELSDWTMFSLTRNAIRAKEFDQFDSFVKKFEETGFIERLRVSRSCLIAEFYLENNKPNKAIALFELISKKHPDAFRPIQGLGNSYSHLKKSRLANKFYKKAERIKEKS